MVCGAGEIARSGLACAAVRWTGRAPAGCRGSTLTSLQYLMNLFFLSRVTSLYPLDVPRLGVPTPPL